MEGGLTINTAIGVSPFRHLCGNTTVSGQFVDRLVAYEGAVHVETDGVGSSPNIDGCSGFQSVASVYWHVVDDCCSFRG